ncbi:MAG: hypothetical protein WC710_14560 [Gallionella sp.]|jgi:hypothetical protein
MIFDEWADKLGMLLGFKDGLPSDLKEKAEALAERGCTLMGAEQWMRAYLCIPKPAV